MQKKQEAVNSAQNRHEILQQRREKFVAELEEQIQENNRIVAEMQRALGIQIATFIIGLPIERLGVVSELTRRFFGSVISEEILEAADRLAKELAVVRRKIENKRDQLAVVLAQLKRATEEMEKAQQELEECKERTS